MADAEPHPNAALIGRFYAALDRRDAATMIACYAPDATFSDPVFPALDAAGVAAMWQMLCARGKDLARRRVGRRRRRRHGPRPLGGDVHVLGDRAPRREPHRRVVRVSRRV